MLTLRPQTNGSPVGGGRMSPRKRAMLVFLLIPAVIITTVQGFVIIEYFHQPGCINCEETDSLIDAIGREYGDRIVVDNIEVGDREGIRLLVSYGVTEIPVVVINRNRVLSYPYITRNRLDEEIRLAESGAYPVPEGRKNILGSDPLLSSLFSFTLGLMTGFSPCLLGSLVLLIAASGGTAGTGNTGRYYPVLFGAGIVTAYLLVAAGILGAGIRFMPDALSRPIIFGIGGIVAVAAGAVQLGVLSLPEKASRLTSDLVLRFHSPPGIFLLGVIFAVIFAPCAIAPFLILIETLLIDSTLRPVLMLVSYSSGLLAPFVAVAVFRDALSEQLLTYAGIVQKAGALLLIGLGIWLILSLA